MTDTPQAPAAPASAGSPPTVSDSAPTSAAESPRSTSDSAPTSAASPLVPWLVGLILLGLTLSPMARPTTYDSFPFSSFPMFAHGRKDAVTSVHRLVAVLPDESTLALPPRLLGSDEVLQVDATLRHAIRAGKRACSKLCRDVARRVADDPAFAGATFVEFRTERHDALAYFAGDTDPLDKPKLRARCKVPQS